MKKMIIGLLLLIPLQIISGQDQIITIQHDTIHCRIISITPAYIQYAQKAEDGNAEGKFISAEQVSTYLRALQPAEIDLYDQTDMQKSKPESKHYFGFSFAKGGRPIGGFWNSAWDQAYLVIGFEYANRKGDREVGVGLNASSTFVFVPITIKSYFGKYIFAGFGLMPGFDPLEGLYIGASLMIGVEYVSKSGFSLSLSPSYRFFAMNLIGNKSNMNYIDIQGPEIQQHAVVSIGIGYRF